VAWLEKHLEQFPGAVLIITHDRYFLDNVTGWILELDRGRGVPYEGNYTVYLDKKAKRLAQQTGEDAARAKVIERERAWMGTSPQRASPNRRPASRPIRSCSKPTKRGCSRARRRSSFLRGPGSAISSSRLRGLQKAMTGRS
jgi:ATPase subunit of ABC transporter with duplicated ATPase domains